MELHFEPITEENRKEAEALSPAPGQENYIESVADCMREADERDSWRPLGIYDGSTLVGFAMYGFFQEYLRPAVSGWTACLSTVIFNTEAMAK